MQSLKDDTARYRGFIAGLMFLEEFPGEELDLDATSWCDIAWESDAEEYGIDVERYSEYTETAAYATRIVPRVRRLHENYKRGHKPALERCEMAAVEGTLFTVYTGKDECDALVIAKTLQQALLDVASYCTNNEERDGVGWAKARGWFALKVTA